MRRRVNPRRRDLKIAAIKLADRKRNSLLSIVRAAPLQTRRTDAGIAIEIDHRHATASSTGGAQLRCGHLRTTLVARGAPAPVRETCDDGAGRQRDMCGTAPNGAP